jgi:hypothetical protein
MLRASLFALAVIALVACDNASAPGKVTGKEVRDSFGEAARTTNAYVSQTRDEVVATGKTKIARADAELATLRAKASGAASDAKAGIDASIAKLEKERAEAAAKLDELQNATGDAWKDMTAGLDRALDELGDAGKEAKRRFD